MMDQDQMSNFNRKQRRAFAKKTGAKPSELQQASGQIGTALEALQKIKGLEGTAKMLEGLGEKIDSAHVMMEALAEDIQTLDNELKVQRQVNLMILARLHSNAELPPKKALAQLTEMEKSVLKELGVPPEEASGEKE